MYFSRRQAAGRLRNAIGPRTRPRRGAAAVEFAVVLPLIVLLLLGSIELGRGVMVTHTLQEAAQAGCRVYSVKETTPQEAQALIDTAMTRAGITGYSIVFVPATKSDMTVHTAPVSVTVSVPFSVVAWLTPSYLASSNLEGKCTMPADLNASGG